MSWPSLPRTMSSGPRTSTNGSNTSSVGCSAPWLCVLVVVVLAPEAPPRGAAAVVVYAPRAPPLPLPLGAEANRRPLSSRRTGCGAPKVVGPTRTAAWRVGAGKQRDAVASMRGMRSAGDIARGPRRGVSGPQVCLPHSKTRHLTRRRRRAVASVLSRGMQQYMHTATACFCETVCVMEHATCASQQRSACGRVSRLARRRQRSSPGSGGNW